MTDKVSYDSPFYADLAANTEQKLGLPDGLLASIVLNGEKSNADQVSSAGARTVFQITPSTRKLAIQKYGIDPYISPENAAEVSGLLLKDSIQRNKGDVNAAVHEYIGGTDRKNWGSRTKAYAGRVLEALVPPAEAADATDTTQPAQDETPAPKISTAASRAADEWLKNNPIQVQPAAPVTEKPVAVQEDVKPATKPLPDAVSKAADAWAKDNPVDAAPKPEPSLMDKVGDMFTGNLRKTKETQTLPEWTGMPELNQMSWASAKTGLGTLVAPPKEIASIIKHNFPDAQVRQDAKGNYLITSSVDGKEYAIPPGFSVGDIPRALGALAAFTPSGAAETLPGMIAGSAATQAAIEGSQAATGGEFNPGDVVAASVIPPIFHGIAKVAGSTGAKLYEAIKSMLPNPAADIKAAVEPVVANAPADIAATAEQIKPAIEAANPEPVIPAAEAAAPVVEAQPHLTISQGADASTASADDAVAAAKQAEADAQQAPIPATSEELAATAKKASEGSVKATNELSDQTLPDAKTVEAAKRLGIDEHLQPDHVTTNQAYRELAQAIKSVPGSAASSAEKEGLASVGERADKLISELGGTDDMSILNDMVKKQLQSLQVETKARASQLYDAVRDMIPPKAEAPATNVLETINARADELGGVKNLSSTEKMILDKLSPTPKGKEPTYALLDDIRRDLTAAKYSNKGAFKDSDDRLLGILEGALKKDQEAAAAKYGAAEKWKLAQSTSAVYKGMQDDLKSLFGDAIEGSLVGNLSKAYQSLPTGDVTRFTRLIGAIKYLPQDTRQEIVASGLNTAFGKNLKNGNINFNSYTQWYEGLLKNKKAHATLFTNLPAGARKRLSDLYRVSKGISLATKERITTGRINAVKDTLKSADNLMAKLYSAAKASGGKLATGLGADALGAHGMGIAFALGSALKGAKTPAIEAVDKLIASPEFIMMARNPTKETVRKFAYDKNFTNFLRKINAPMSMSDREKWIIQSLQASNEASTN